MDNVTIQRATLTDIANAIRTKGETSAPLFPAEMANAIMNLWTNDALTGYAYTEVTGNQYLSASGKLTNMKATYRLQQNAKFYVVSLMAARRNATTPDSMLVTRMYGKNIIGDTIFEVKSTTSGLGVAKTSTDFTIYTNQEFSSGSYNWRFLAFWLE